jgi:hypothetical protein
VSEKELLARLEEEEEEPGPLTTAYCCLCKHFTSSEKCDDCYSGRNTEYLLGIPYSEPDMQIWTDF